MSDYNPIMDDEERKALVSEYKKTTNKFEQCVINPVGDEYCYFHKCGPSDPEQCGKKECPHCTIKAIKDSKFPLTNSYLKAKDAGEIA